MKRRTQKIGGGKGSKAFAGVAAIPLVSASGGAGLFIILAALFLFLSTFQPQALSGLRMSTTDMFAPALNIISTPLQKTAIFVRDVTGLAEIQAENARLAQENIKLREWYQTALLLEAENQSLRELMNVKIEPRHTYITARILSDSSSSFAKSLLLSAGTQDGVRRGQAVIAGDGLIGRVIEAGEKTARVLLITDMNSRVPVLIEDSRQQAIFSGKNTHSGMLVHLPPGSKVSEGARVITSGVGGIFPMGLPVGLVSAVGDDIVVEPFADFNRLMHVRIVNRSEDPNLHHGGL